jgi:phage tail-like protein
MVTTRRSDPFGSFRFLVEMESLVVGGFSEVTGLGIEAETEEYREGGINDFVHNLYKGAKYPRLVLKRGVTNSDTLWKWQTQIRDGEVARHTVHVILLGETGEREWDWRLVGAYPVKWSGPDFKADGSVVAVEALELVHNGVRGNPL